MWQRTPESHTHSTRVHSWTISDCSSSTFYFIFPRQHNRPALISYMSYIIFTVHHVKKKKDILCRERGWWNESPPEEVLSSVYYMSSCSNGQIGFPLIPENIIRTSIWDKLWADWRFSEGAEQPTGLKEMIRNQVSQDYSPRSVSCETLLY